MKDPIVEEIRRARQEHARQFNNDLHAICEDLRKSEAVSGRKIITQLPEKTNRDW